MTTILEINEDNINLSTVSNVHNQEDEAQNESPVNEPEIERNFENILQMRERITRYRDNEFLGKHLTNFNLSKEYLHSLSEIELDELLKQIKYSIGVKNT